MNKVFYPDVMVDSIHHIDMEGLIKSGIKGLILDIDNTLVGHGIMDADDKLIGWIEKAKSMGMNICIASNNTEDRVVKFSEKLKVLAIHRASKPRRKSFLKAADMMKISPKEAAVIGDQIFTDIVGGNRAGMLTIMVQPVDAKEPFFIKWKRVLERMVLRGYVPKK